jgi:hypothetical protein
MQVDLNKIFWHTPLNACNNQREKHSVLVKTERQRLPQASWTKEWPSYYLPQNGEQPGSEKLDLGEKSSVISHYIFFCSFGDLSSSLWVVNAENMDHGTHSTGKVVHSTPINSEFVAWLAKTNLLAYRQALEDQGLEAWLWKIMYIIMHYYNMHDSGSMH